MQIQAQEKQLTELDALATKRRQLRNLQVFMEEGDQVAKELRAIEAELGMTDEDV